MIKPEIRSESLNPERPKPEIPEIREISRQLSDSDFGSIETHAAPLHSAPALRFHLLAQQADFELQ